MPSLPWRSKNVARGWDKRSSGFVTHVTFFGLSMSIGETGRYWEGSGETEETAETRS